MPAAVRDGVWRGDTALLRTDGQEVPISQVIVVQRSADGHLDSFATIARDMTEPRRVEARMAALLAIAKDISGTLEAQRNLGTRAEAHRRRAAL